jgi:hypothetical protein
VRWWCDGGAESFGRRAPKRGVRRECGVISSQHQDLNCSGQCNVRLYSSNNVCSRDDTRKFKRGVEGEDEHRGPFGSGSAMIRCIRRTVTTREVDAENALI